MKLAFKLGLFLVLGMWVVLGLEFWISARRDLSFHETDARQDQHITGQVLRVAFTKVWQAEGRVPALAFIDQANRASGQAYVRWIEFGAPSGDRLAPQLPRSELAQVEQGHEIQRTLKLEHRSARVYTYLPVSVGGVAGALELSESLAEPRRHIRGALWRRIATATALGGLSGLIAMLLGTLLVGQPIRRLVDKTRRIAAGDLSRPLALHQHDEIGELAREIDAMCERLTAARAQIAAETAARFSAIDQLRHADRLATVGKLASGVAHELGTPLNVASERARMIASGEVSGAAAADGARIIAEQTQRMTSIIRQLLAFARRHTPNKARHDLQRIARDTAALLLPLAERRGVVLRVKEDRLGSTAEVDPEQIQQALANLVVNGIQAMERGGELWITVETRVVRPPADHESPQGRHVCLSVQDQGPGISAEHLPHVFEPFFTTKDVGEGTGLGLAVAYGIVRDHNGWIDVDSKPGHGSKFSIFVPCEERA